MSTPPSSARASPAAKARMADKSPSRVAAGTGTGLARNPSLRSSRPIRKGTTRPSLSGEVAEDEDGKAATTQIIADLKEQVERAEQASEHYRKQLDAMQQRLDEVANETTAAEERELYFKTQIDQLQADLRESARQNREVELSFDSDKKLLLQDRDKQSAKEIELQSVVKRLTENLKLKNQELVHTRQDSAGTTHKQPHDTSDSNAYLEIIQAKDSVIESLQLELADFQMKIAEQEHIGDGRSQALETQLLDIKMKNARLLEENESFQMLLSEKTLKGDFMHDQNPSGLPVSSLAEELERTEDGEISPEAYRLMEGENKTLRDSNKALTTYIDKIIGRILTSGYEHIMTGADSEAKPHPPAKPEKKLPEIPEGHAEELATASSSPPTATAVATAATAATAAAAGLLQRARSVVSRPTPPSKSRPISMLPPTANENPETAPSIPLARGHRRARSDQANDLGAASVVQQMNRGAALRTSSGPMSPGMPPLSPIANHRHSYFGPSGRGPSSGNPSRPESSSNSVGSDHSLEQDAATTTTDASSNRASMNAGASAETSTSNRASTYGIALPGAVMKQNQLRPLRLVQEQKDENDKKANNRASWMGWFNKGATAAPSNAPHLEGE